MSQYFADSEVFAIVLAAILISWGSYYSEKAFRGAMAFLMVFTLANVLILKKQGVEQQSTVDRWFFKWQTNDRAKN